MISRHFFIATTLSLLVAGAFAQTSATPSVASPVAAASVQRDANQQTRIESGLKDGSLSTREAGRLESAQARVDRLQAKDLKDGKLSPAERTQLSRAQNRVSQQIAAARHNDVTGNPASASSQRMQADAARNANQQSRVAEGLRSGELTKHEAAKLEAGQAVVARKEAAAASNGHVGHAEQRNIQRTENRQSRRIHREKTDAQTHG